MLRREPAPAVFVGTLIVVAVAAVVLLLLVLWRSNPLAGEEQMLIVARRGDIAAWPENTLEGVRAAAERGAHGIEFDLRLSRDGIWYLMHDADLGRTTNGEGEIASHRGAAIDELVITGGLGFNSGHEGRLHVPRLDAVLDALAAYDGILLFDLKVPGGAQHAAIAQIIVERDLVSRSRVACYLPDASAAIAAVRSVHPDIAVYLPGQIGDVSETFGVDSILVNVHDLDGPVSQLNPTAEVDAAIHASHEGDESEFLANARSWGIRRYLTNDVSAALTWVEGQ